MKSSSASSQREKQHRWNGVSVYNRTKIARTKPTPEKGVTSKEKRELAAIAALADDQIDTSDIPELPPSAWKNAVRGRFYRPVKQAVSLRLDADVVAWLKKPGKGYQTRVNHILRERMLADVRKIRHEASASNSQMLFEGSPVHACADMCSATPETVFDTKRMRFRMSAGRTDPNGRASLISDRLGTLRSSSI